MKPVLPIGAKLWVGHESEIWTKADVVQVDESTGLIKVALQTTNQIVPLPPVYYLRNEDVMTKDGIQTLDDLTHLTHLHEAAVLNSLNQRFDQDSIYTLTGPILIAVNPFKRLPGLYDEDTLKHYIAEGWKQTFTLDRKPHVFCTAVDAYRGLCQNRVNQTILISGESGAGKTESTKFVMKLLALAGSKDWANRSPVENQVLQSNPLLESFGNAKTLRNDNSSRFGKFIEMQFRLENDTTVGGFVGRLAGARIQTYLLETVRVCRQLGKERNYHAFYQLAAAGLWAHEENAGRIKITPQEAQALGVSITHPLEYNFPHYASLNTLRYVSCSGCQTLDGVDDLEEFKRTALAMNTVGINALDQQETWNLVGAVLILGSVFFSAPSGNSEASAIPDQSAESLTLAAQLLGLTTPQLAKCLTSRSIHVQKERYNKPLTIEQAEDARDALARALYGTMFLHIVKQTNKSIGYQEDVELSCGVLDIFGFECFEINSFEQLCINFTNERLQQFFNTFIFKCEESLYKAEGISWDPLDFPDNQDCVDLLAGARTGLFAMLDEECVVPKGTDGNFCAKLKAAHKTHRRFGIIKTRQEWFTINHFAGPVHYCAKGFLDKNRDQLSLDTQEAIKESSNHFVANLFNTFLDRSTNEPSKKMKKVVTVSLEFRNQLASLMNTVQQTEPHFIRCVKPNPQNKPDIFHRKSVAEQLRYAGVLQAVQVSRAGFPVREVHASCWEEYRALLPKEIRKRLMDLPAQERALQMMQNLNDIYKIPKPKHGGDTSWAVGATMVFLKHEAFEIISTRQSQMKQRNTTRIQAVWFGFLRRRWYRAALAAVETIQRGVRCSQARQRTTGLRRVRAATIICAYVRRHLAMKYKARVVREVTRVQAVIRGKLARAYVSRLREERAALRLQSFVRMVACRRTYKKRRGAIIATQLRWKQRQAYRQLQKLRIEAKNVAGLAEQKAQLQETLRLAQVELETLRKQLVEARENLREQDLELSNLKIKVASAGDAKLLEEELAALTKKRDAELAEAEGLKHESHQLRLQVRQLEDTVTHLTHTLTRTSQEKSELSDTLTQTAQENTTLKLTPPKEIFRRSNSALTELALLRAKVAELEALNKSLVENARPAVIDETRHEFFDKGTSPMIRDATPNKRDITHKEPSPITRDNTPLIGHNIIHLRRDGSSVKGDGSPVAGDGSPFKRDHSSMHQSGTSGVGDASTSHENRSPAGRLSEVFVKGVSGSPSRKDGSPLHSDASQRQGDGRLKEETGRQSSMQVLESSGSPPESTEASPESGHLRSSPQMLRSSGDMETEVRLPMMETYGVVTRETRQAGETTRQLNESASYAQQTPSFVRQPTDSASFAPRGDGDGEKDKDEIRGKGDETGTEKGDETGRGEASGVHAFQTDGENRDTEAVLREGSSETGKECLYGGDMYGLVRANDVANYHKLLRPSESLVRSVDRVEEETRRLEVDLARLMDENLQLKQLEAEQKRRSEEIISEMQDKLVVAFKQQEELELEVAKNKKAAHEASESLQSLTPPDCGEFVNTIIQAVQPESVQRDECPIKGHLLLIGDVSEIGAKTLSAVQHWLTWEPFNMQRLEMLKQNKNQNCSSQVTWYTRREFSLLNRNCPHPLKIFVINHDEIASLSEANQQRLKRNFYYAGFLIDNKQDLKAQTTNTKIWTNMHVDTMKFLIVDEESHLDYETRKAYSRNGIFITDVTDFPQVLECMTRNVQRKQEELVSDLHRLRSLLSPPSKRKAMSPSKAMSKSQTASALSEFVVNGLASMFGGGKSRTNLHAGRGRGDVIPNGSDLLVESMQGDVSLLQSVKDKDRAVSQGEVVQWQSVVVPNKTAVTCLRFAKPSLAANFFFLAVATKGGLIYCYKVAKTASDVAMCRDLESETCLTTTTTQSSAQDPEDARAEQAWLEAPKEPVEFWRQLEGHEKAVTSIFFTHDDQQLVSTSIDCSVRFWDIKLGHPSKIFSDSVAILVASLLPTDPKCFLTSNSRSILRLVDSVEGNVIQRLKVESEIRAICFDTSGLNLIAGTKDGHLESYEIEGESKLSYTSRTLIGSTTPPTAVTCVRYVAGQPPTVVVNTCDNHIAVAICNFSLSSVALTGFTVKQRLKISHNCLPLSLTILRKETFSWVVSGSEDARLKVFARLTTGQNGEFHPVMDLKGHGHSILTVDSNEVDTVLGSADVSGHVILWRKAGFRATGQKQQQ